LARRSGHEKHGVAVPDYGVFMAAKEPEWDIGIRGKKLYYPQDVDLRPRPDAMIVDAGCPIPGVSDAFAGEGPDIGAYEAGEPPPHYGPRTFDVWAYLAEYREREARDDQ
jgi:hypothetical protein